MVNKDETTCRCEPALSTLRQTSPKVPQMRNRQASLATHALILLAVLAGAYVPCDLYSCYQ